MSNEEVPSPPSLTEAIRVSHGLSPRTVMDELHIQFEARLRANRGRLVPLSAEELSVPEPPDFTAAFRKEKK